MILRLPDNCAPYVIIYTGAQLSGQGRSCQGQGRSCRARGAAVGNIGMHTYIRHICAPVHVREILQHYIYQSDQGLVAAGYSTICIKS